MKTYKEIIKKGYDNNKSEELMWQITDMTSDYIASMGMLHPSETYGLLENIENLICYPALTKEEAEAYVAKMTNKDGSTGAHWTLEQTNAYRNSHPDMQKMSELDFFVALNMMYSDYYKPSYTTDTYASMAKDFVLDADAPKNKVKRYMSVM